MFVCLSVWLSVSLSQSSLAAASLRGRGRGRGRVVGLVGGAFFTVLYVLLLSAGLQYSSARLFFSPLPSVLPPPEQPSTQHHQ